MSIYSLAAAASALALLSAAPLRAAPAKAPAAVADKKAGSTYLRCDGEPNNVTGGETAARLLGAVTLLGLFAPAPEAADGSKRKFGAEGVAACTALLEGDKKEGNPKRRLGLLIARAIHRIEAKDYAASIADAGLARAEAEAAGLMADPYFTRTRGRAFDLIESAALLRMGKPADAREAALRGLANVQYSLIGLVSTPDYSELVRTPSEADDRHKEWLARLYPGSANDRADRLELLGRFAEAARVRDALVDYDVVNSPEVNSSVLMAKAAVAHALAGNGVVAKERASAARANADKRKADGKPEEDLAEYVELADLHAIVDSAGAGDAKGARRLFAARSQWVGASLGSVMEVNRRLRVGASADELIGGLAKDSDALWKDRSDAKLAERLAKDDDNKTLFDLAPGAMPGSAFEAMSKQVWRTDKSKMLLKPSERAKTTSKMETLFLFGVSPAVAVDAYALHAALLARSRGHAGFVMTPILADTYSGAAIRTGSRGEPGLPEDLFLDAGDVIAKLSPIIPDPAALKLRKASAAKQSAAR